MRYLITPKCISLNYDGISKAIDIADVRFNKVLEAIKSKNFDAIPNIVDGLKNVLAISSNASFKVENGMVYIDNTPVTGCISDRITEYVKQGLDPYMLVNFWRNLQKNPSKRARDRLFLFLENGNHPFTDDGCFIAYKKVNANMTDNYTGTIDNSVGAKPHMDRSRISDDPESLCSEGLHVASWTYAQNYAGQVLIDVKVNPQFVVSIPVDHQNQKMRVTDYEVIAISKGKHEELHMSDNLKDMDEEDEDNGDYDDIKTSFDTSSPEFKQGESDAKALLAYFDSIGQSYDRKSFMKLKRFENKSQLYKEGVNIVVSEYFTK